MRASDKIFHQILNSSRFVEIENGDYKFTGKSGYLELDFCFGQNDEYENVQIIDCAITSLTKRTPYTITPYQLRLLQIKATELLKTQWKTEKDIADEERFERIEAYDIREHGVYGFGY